MKISADVRIFAVNMTVKRKVFLGLFTLVAATAIVVLWLYDPVGGAFPYPKCLFKQVTGLDCPGCGSARAFHALFNGRFADAWAVNPAVFFAIPLATAAIIAEMRPYSRLRRILLSVPAMSALLTAIILWTIFRNL